jgi:uncharacterized protein (DUF433 family)
MTTLFVPTAEAAFIAGITDRDINRVVDEQILPGSLVRNDNGRRFARLGAALAGFYFRSDDVYSAAMRRRVVEEVVGMLRARRDRDTILSLGAGVLQAIDWRIAMPSALVGIVLVDVGVFVERAVERVKALGRAEELVSTDSQTLGGLPVFTGTRLPIDAVLSSLRNGVDRKRIFDAYPNLTNEHLEAAQVYFDVHPRRGRPGKASMPPPTWQLKSTRRISRRTTATGLGSRTGS